MGARVLRVSKGVVFLHENGQNLPAPPDRRAWSSGECGADAGDDGDRAGGLARAPPGAALWRFVRRTGRRLGGGWRGWQRCGVKG